MHSADLSFFKDDFESSSFDENSSLDGFSTVKDARSTKSFATKIPSILVDLIKNFKSKLTFPLLWSPDPMQLPVSFFSSEVFQHVLAYISFSRIQFVQQISQKQPADLTASFTIACFSPDLQCFEQIFSAMEKLPANWSWKQIKVPKTFISFSAEFSAPYQRKALEDSLSFCSSAVALRSVELSSQIFSH